MCIRDRLKVDRIHTELPIVQFDDGINRQIFLSAEVFRLGMGSICLLYTSRIRQNIAHTLHAELFNNGFRSIVCKVHSIATKCYPD